jgi:hypothetical protein
MSIMDKPDRPSGLQTESTDSVYLAEEGDEASIKAENDDYGDLVAYIRSRFNRSKTQRKYDEERWIHAYRNYRGIYGPDVQFTSTEKSKAFVKITKTKVLASYAQITDILFAGNKFPIGVDPTPVPIGVRVAHFDPQRPSDDQIEQKLGKEAKEKLKQPVRKELISDLGGYSAQLDPIKDVLQEGPAPTATGVTIDPAREGAIRMERLIHDQLEESEADKHIRNFVFDMCLFGSGVMKGPFAYDKEYPRWTSEGTYDPEFKTIAKSEQVSVWSFYPDPDARSMDDAEFTIQRHRMNKHQLRALKKRPMFRAESIELAIDMGANYVSEYWEDILEDDAQVEDHTRYEVLEYWGWVDREEAEKSGLEIPEKFEDADEVQVNVWVCNSQILRLVLNPFTPARIPYNLAPYELNPYSIFGIGVAENMEDTQLLMNGFMRMAVDNAALSGNIIIEVDETNLVPGQSMDIYPGKIFRRQSGAPGQAIFGTKFPNITQELLYMFDKARQLADEATGMPSYAHGSTGVMGVGRTASGMSMLMGAAAQNIKAVVRNIDDYLLSPWGKAHFAFNMQFNFDEIFLGDLEVLARGTESLMRNEVRSQKLLQFMQMTANPMMSPFVKYEYVLKELAKSMDLDEERLLNDPIEAGIQAKMMAEIAAMMPQPPQGAEQAPAGPGGPPPVSDPTQTGNGNIAPGAAPEPGAAGFTGNAQGGQPPMPPQ